MKKVRVGFVGAGWRGSCKTPCKKRSGRIPTLQSHEPERCRAEGCEALVWPAETATPDSGNVIEHQTGACVAHFIECIKTGRPSPLSFANSAPIAEIGWAARISAATGREVALPRDLAAAAFFAGKEG